MMKAETKAKRRVTLSFCGLGMLDETEVESIPGARADIGDATSAKPRAVDAEIVQPKAAEKPAPSTPPDELPKASAQQVTALCAAMTAIGLKERAAVLKWINARIAPRTVESRLDLTSKEAIDLTEKAKTIANDKAKE